MRCCAASTESDALIELRERYDAVRDALLRSLDGKFPERYDAVRNALLRSLDGK